ncbi:unnamed protein product [Pseudo-nitzschia multistriata]|uniref:Uncharacterized protein n=1 Tax=Pseudo-nitzschia multistriata TaxID=183589 RepID=A0A448Z117_9STRA|nr:unnamed protein product [Pseudo-nitzschia multistriata]
MARFFSTEHTITSTSSSTPDDDDDNNGNGNGNGNNTKESAPTTPEETMHAAHRRHSATAAAAAPGGGKKAPAEIGGSPPSHRRRRTGASRNDHHADGNPRHQSPVESSPNSKTKLPRGFWSSLKRAVGSGDKGHPAGANGSTGSGGDTLLPTTYSGTHGLHGGRATQHRMPVIPLCGSGNGNSFLMGGVDKRRFRRRRSLVYRVFWSSPPRRLCVAFFLLYTAVYHVLVPLGNLCLSGPPLAVWWHLPTAGPNGEAILERLAPPGGGHRWSLPLARRGQGRLVEERARLRDGGSGFGLEPRGALLEAIAPEWHHRWRKAVGDGDGGRTSSNDNNDDGADGDDAMEEAPVGDHGETDRAKETETEAKNENENEAKKDNSANEATAPPLKKIRYHKAVDSPRSTNGTTRRLLEVVGGTAAERDSGKPSDSPSLPLRTIHNQHELAGPYSSCGTHQARQATTLVVQTSIDRMWILKETCARWSTDPIVAVVFVPHASAYGGGSGNGEYAMLTDLLDRTEKQLAPAETDESPCPHLTIVRYLADAAESRNGRYPVNRMRNVGLDLVSTSHVMVIDVDFLPSNGLDRFLGDWLATGRGGENHRRPPAVVVPAFERRAPSGCEGRATIAETASCLSKFLREDGGFLPRTFGELSDCYSEEDCVVFQSEFNWDGHSTTRSSEWLQRKWYEPDGGDETDDNNNDADADADGHRRAFRKIPCFHTARYEPYVVLEWCPLAGGNAANDASRPLAPYYDERFYGYGKNKIELVSHLRRSGYEFSVLPEGFIVHNPHPESATKETWKRNGSGAEPKDGPGTTEKLHSAMDALYRDFMKELDAMYRADRGDALKLCQKGHR